MACYQFTQEQFCRVLADTIDMYLEYVDVHGYEPVRAATAAIDEIVQGLDAERELIRLGEMNGLNQVSL